MNDNKLRVGIIGSEGFMGGMAQAVWEGYLKRDGLTEVVALADKRLKSGSRGGVTLFGGDENCGFKLIEKAKSLGLDLVDISVPTHFHYQLAYAAAEKGLHTFVQKPMTRYLCEADVLLRVVDGEGVKMTVGYVLAFWDVYMIAADTIKQNNLQIIGIEGGRFTLFPRNADYDGVLNNWFRREDYSGGALLDLHPHDLAVFMLKFFGAKVPEIVHATGTRNVALGGWPNVDATYYFRREDGILVPVRTRAAWDIAEDSEYGGFTHYFRIHAKTKDGRQVTIKMDSRNLSLEGKTLQAETELKGLNPYISQGVEMVGNTKAYRGEGIKYCLVVTYQDTGGEEKTVLPTLPPKLPPVPGGNISDPGGYYTEKANFARYCLGQNASPIVTGKQARDILYIIETLTKESMEKGGMEVSPIRGG